MPLKNIVEIYWTYIEVLQLIIEIIIFSFAKYIGKELL